MNALPAVGECLEVDPARVSITARIAIADAVARRAASTPYVRAIADRIASLRPDYGPPDGARAALALAWVASFRRVPDCPGRDTVADVLFTLGCKEGDCLNLSAALLALLLALGYRAHLRHVVLPANTQDHVAVEVDTWVGWQWADPMYEEGPAQLGILAVSEAWTYGPGPVLE